MAIPRFRDDVAEEATPWTTERAKSLLLELGLGVDQQARRQGHDRLPGRN
jgi:hypothetical protein